MEKFSIEITVDGRGVRAVRLYGNDWEKSAKAYALLGRIGCLIRQLDIAAKEGNLPISLLSSEEGLKDG